MTVSQADGAVANRRTESGIIKAFWVEYIQHNVILHVAIRHVADFCNVRTITTHPCKDG